MKNTLVVLVGMSGSGKTTVARALCDLYGWCEAVSTTTREPRDGEGEGVDYYFTSKGKFKEDVKKGLFVENVEFGGNFYGMTSSELQDKTERNHTVLVVEPVGAAQIKKMYQGDVKFIHLDVCEGIRESRMLGRGDTEDAVGVRMANDREYWPTVEGLVEYDYKWDNNQDGPSTPSLVGLAGEIMRTDV